MSRAQKVAKYYLHQKLQLFDFFFSVKFGNFWSFSVFIIVIEWKTVRIDYFTSTFHRFSCCFLATKNRKQQLEFLLSYFRPNWTCLGQFLDLRFKSKLLLQKYWHFFATFFKLTPTFGKITSCNFDTIIPQLFPSPTHKPKNIQGSYHESSLITLIRPFLRMWCWYVLPQMTFGPSTMSTNGRMRSKITVPTLQSSWLVPKSTFERPPSKARGLRSTNGETPSKNLFVTSKENERQKKSGPSSILKARPKHRKAWTLFLMRLWGSFDKGKRSRHKRRENAISYDVLLGLSFILYYNIISKEDLKSLW